MTMCAKQLEAHKVKMTRITRSLTEAPPLLSSVQGFLLGEHSSSALHQRADVPRSRLWLERTGRAKNSLAAALSTRTPSNRQLSARLSVPTASVQEVPANMMINTR